MHFGVASPDRWDGAAPGNLPAVMRRHLAPLAVVLAVLAPLAACGDDGGDESVENTTTAPAQDPIAGRTFESAELTGTAPPLVDGVPITIAFGDDHDLTIEAGCDPITGSYTVDGPILVVRGLSGLQSGCTPGLLPQNEWIADIIVTRPVITPTPPDGLVLSDDGWSLTMVEAGTAEATLTGTGWTLAALVDGEVSTPISNEVTASIAFSADGRYEVFAGCNSGNGTYTPPAGGATIEVEAPTLTRERCGEDATEVENAVVATLDGSVTVELGADRLTLTSADGAGLAFTTG